MNKKQNKSRAKLVMGSGNVFADIGVKNPEESLMKAELAAVIGGLIRKLDMNQADVAERLGVDQPKVSMLLRGRLKDFSIERLFRFVHALEQDIKIVISPHRKNRKSERVLVEVAA